MRRNSHRVCDRCRRSLNIPGKQGVRAGDSWLNICPSLAPVPSVFSRRLSEWQLHLSGPISEHHLNPDLGHLKRASERRRLSLEANRFPPWRRPNCARNIQGCLKTHTGAPSKKTQQNARKNVLRRTALRVQTEGNSFACLMPVSEFRFRGKYFPPSPPP